MFDKPTRSEIPAVTNLVQRPSPALLLLAFHAILTHVAEPAKTRS